MGMRLGWKVAGVRPATFGRWGLSLALAGALGCPGGPPPASCGVDGGGLQSAQAQFQSYLTGLVGCSQDSDCVAIEMPCANKSFCGAQTAAVPLTQEAAAVEEASTLTAELCSPACLDGGEFDCSDEETSGQTPSCVANRCTMAIPGLDGGSQAFAASCGNGCDAPFEFCDVSTLEEQCGGDGGAGLVVLATGSGVCATAEASAIDSSCASDLDCSEELACVSNDPTGGPCGDCTNDDCSCSCEPTCTAPQFTTCPAGCSGPLDDGRGCAVCECEVCPGLKPARAMAARRRGPSAHPWLSSEMPWPRNSSRAMIDLWISVGPS